MKRLSIILLVLLTVIVLTACGEELPEDGGFVTPEGSAADSISTEATPTPDLVAPTQESTSTPRPTLTPVPTYADLYRDDAVAAVTTYLDARNAHDQAAMDRAMTTATVEEGLNTVERYQRVAFAGRGWGDYPIITINEITHIQCDEILCKLNYLIHSVPPGDGTGRTAPFDDTDFSWVRLVSGVWLVDITSETYLDEFQSTHRK